MKRQTGCAAAVMLTLAGAATRIVPTTLEIAADAVSVRPFVAARVGFFVDDVELVLEP